MGSGTKSLGQLLIIGLEETKWTSSHERLIRRIQPGGVHLTQHNLHSPNLTAEMLRKIVGAMKVPPFLALEEEGGSFDPLSKFFPRLPSPHLAAMKGLAVVERLGTLIGEALALLGFNLDFAPRLDLANPDVKPSLQPQRFHADPEKVTLCGKAFTNGLRRRKILACGKYFPGHARAEYASGSPLPIVDKPMAELWREDLFPYRNLHSSLPLLKFSYSAYKAYDLDLIVTAACSVNILRGLLRMKIGYRGVAIADHLAPIMEAGRGTSGEPPWEVDATVPLKAYIAPLIAGCDMQIAPMWRTKSAELHMLALADGTRNGSLAPQRVDEALKRIQRAKRGLRLPPPKFPGKSYERLCRKFEDFRKDIQTMERERA